MEFRDKVVESFSKIKEDISRLDRSASHSREKLEFLDKRVDEVSYGLDLVQSRINDIVSALVSKTVPSGNSSKGSDGLAKRVPTVSTLPGHPTVSNGTSSTGTKRAAKIKQHILKLLPSTRLLKDLYSEIVLGHELCSKTSFYRFVSELEKEGAVEIFLEKNQRKIRNKNL